MILIHCVEVYFEAGHVVTFLMLHMVLHVDAWSTRVCSVGADKRDYQQCERVCPQKRDCTSVSSHCVQTSSYIDIYIKQIKTCDLFIEL